MFGIIRLHQNSSTRAFYNFCKSSAPRLYHGNSGSHRLQKEEAFGLGIVFRDRKHAQMVEKIHFGPAVDFTMVVELSG